MTDRVAELEMQVRRQSATLRRIAMRIREHMDRQERERIINLEDAEAAGDYVAPEVMVR